jgi:hypothetical protein
MRNSIPSDEVSSVQLARVSQAMATRGVHSPNSTGLKTSANIFLSEQRQFP